MRKIQFGCGTNILHDWENRDIECDIRKLPLAYDHNSLDAIFCEHCLEHTDIHQALYFLEECHRILKPGGLIRIAVPSIEQINIKSTSAYEQFCFDRHWAKTNDKAGAIRSIIECHGHQSCWSQSILNIYLETAGFKNVESAEIYDSKHDILKNTNGHQKVIGEPFNTLETVVAEGTK